MGRLEASLGYAAQGIDEFLALAIGRKEAAGDRHPLFNPSGRGRPGIRHGHPDLRPAGAGRPADHRLRRRHPTAQLHLRRRRGRRADPADGGTQAIGSIHIGNGEEISSGAGREDQGHDGEHIGDRDHSLRSAYEAGFEDMPRRCRTSPRSAAWSATSQGPARRNPDPGHRYIRPADVAGGTTEIQDIEYDRVG